MKKGKNLFLIVSISGILIFSAGLCVFGESIIRKYNNDDWFLEFCVVCKDASARAAVITLLLSVIKHNVHFISQRNNDHLEHNATEVKSLDEYVVFHYPNGSESPPTVEESQCTPHRLLTLVKNVTDRMKITLQQDIYKYSRNGNNICGELSQIQT